MTINFALDAVFSGSNVDKPYIAFAVFMDITFPSSTAVRMSDELFTADLNSSIKLTRFVENIENLLCAIKFSYAVISSEVIT